MREVLKSILQVRHLGIFAGRTNMLAFWMMLVSGCGANIRGGSTESVGDPGQMATFILTGASEFNLASSLSSRLTNIEFDVYATCGARGTTNSVTHSGYVLASSETFSLGADCTSPEVHIENVDVTYENVNGSLPLNATLIDYSDSIVHENSILVLERTVTGINAQFEIRERVLAKTIVGPDVGLAPKTVSAELNNEPNAYCSGVTVTVAADTITATFDNPEAGSPAGTYTFSADDGGLPAGAIETESAPSVEYDFSSVSEADFTGTYSFTMAMVPNGGQPKDYERCDATVSFDLHREVVNHSPTFLFSNYSNLANWSGLGTLTDPYMFDIDAGTSTGEMSFAIGDGDGQTSALILCNSLPAWASIDDTADKVTFAPGGGISGSFAFDCRANDSIIDSYRSVYFDVTVN